jgi:hypothetical protein
MSRALRSGSGTNFFEGWKRLGDGVLTARCGFAQAGPSIKRAACKIPGNQANRGSLPRGGPFHFNCFDYFVYFVYAH